MLLGFSNCQIALRCCHTRASHAIREVYSAATSLRAVKAHNTLVARPVSSAGSPSLCLLTLR